MRQASPAKAGDTSYSAATASAWSASIRSPAAPIARGIGLDRPFFDDKNRAFWMLQGGGWFAYLMLRALSGLAKTRYRVSEQNPQAIPVRVVGRYEIEVE